MAASRKTHRSMLFAIALVFALVVAGGAGLAFSSIMKQSSYWVVNQDVPARTRVTSSMLTEKKTTAGTQPEAMTASYVDSNEVYAEYALAPGDILTNSNAGPLKKITAGIPDDFSVSSFTVSATNAAVGMAKRGDYIDIYTVDNSNGDESAQLVLQHVLVLDAVSSLDEVSARNAGNASDSSSSSSSDGSNSPSASTASTVSTIYQVGLSRDDTAKLALLSTKNLFVALSPADGPSAPLPSPKLGIDLGTPGDSGKGTDPTFSNGSDASPSPSTTEGKTKDGTTAQSGE